MTTTSSRRSLSDVNRDLDECRRSINAALDESTNILNAANGGELSGGTLTRYNDLDRHTEKERDRLVVLEAERDEFLGQLAAIRTAAGIPGRTEHGDGARRDPVPGMRRTGDPWRERTAPSYGADGLSVRGMAFEAIERNDNLDDGQKQRMTELVESAGTTHYDADNDMARWALMASDPHYASAFRKIVRHPIAYPAMLDDNERHAFARMAELQTRAAMAEGVTTTGGFMVPAHLDPAIILTNNGTANAFRRVARVETVGTQTWKGITSAGVTAEWTAEAAEAADASPTIAQPTITPVRADAYLQASFEMLQDTNIDSEVAGLIADAKDRLEGAAFATGTGSTQPWGLITRLAATTASRVAGTSGAAGAADFVVADIYAVDNALPARHRRNATWMTHNTSRNRIRQFATGSGPQGAFWTDLGGGAPPMLIGYPIYESSDMDDTIVSGSTDSVLVLGDFKKYCIVDRVGVTIQFDPLVKGTNQRPNGQVGWFAFWRVSADTLDLNAFRVLTL